MSAPTAEVKRVVIAFAEAGIDTTWRHCRALRTGRRVRERGRHVWKGRAEIKVATNHSRHHVQGSRLTILETSIRFPEPRLAIARSRWLLENHVSRMASLFRAKRRAG